MANKLNEKSSPPLLRWAGSKRRLLKHILPFCDNTHSYIEPFVGSGQLFFASDYQEVTIGDTNEELIYTYEIIRDFPLELHTYVKSLPISKEAYYEIRSRSTETLTPIERAGRFIYLNRLCFNGLYRTNSKGEFNVPYGASKSNNIPEDKRFVFASEKLKSAKIVCSDFSSTVLNNLTENSFVYLDPPYFTNSTRVFKEYGANSFASPDLARLASVLLKIDDCGAKFVLSYLECEEADHYFGSWLRFSVNIQRTIAGNSSKRKVAKELIISNFKHC